MLDDTQLRVHASRALVRIAVPVKVGLCDSQAWQASITVKTERQIGIDSCFIIKGRPLLTVEQKVRVGKGLNHAVVIFLCCGPGRCASNTKDQVGIPPLAWHEACYGICADDVSAWQAYQGF